MKTSVGAEQPPPPSAPSTRICDLDQAEAYVASVCFKHGPPRLLGVELEWTVHHRLDPSRPVTAQQLSNALGHHAPPTINPQSAQLPLPAGSPVTVEPGGQVEVSASPTASAAELIEIAAADAASLAGLLAAHDLVIGDHAFDPHRQPTRILRSPRYDAMHAAFDRIGPHGPQMMCSTASVQVCLDAGQADRIADRWRAVHAIGPALVALFANSSEAERRHSGWASSRLRATLGTCPPVTSPPPRSADPVAAWVRTALDAPVICLLSEGQSWAAPAGLTFAGWIDDPSQVGRPPDQADLDYHLTTLFPPVRPKGYFEIRYLDAQPGDGWITAFALTAALLSDEATTDRALDLTESTADLWLDAARHGWDHPALRRTAEDLVEVGVAALPGLGLTTTQSSFVIDDLDGLITRQSTERQTTERRCSA